MPFTLIFLFNGYSLTGQMQKWNVVKLENDYVEVYVLPSDGGKFGVPLKNPRGKNSFTAMR